MDTTTTLHDLSLADLRALDDAALNMVVARARGWRVEHHPRGNDWWRLLRPDGTPAYTVEDANGWVRTEHDAWLAVPNVAGDLNDWKASRNGQDHD